MTLNSIAQTLHDTRDTEQCMTILRRRHKGPMALRSALSRVRRWFVDRDERHPDYERLLLQRRESVDSERAKTLDAFRACSLRRQLLLQRKMRADPKSTLFHAEDAAFVRDLPLLPDHVRDLVMNKDEQDALEDYSRDTMRQKSSDVIKIERADELIASCRRFLRDPDATMEEVAVGLGVCTGRRMVELFLTGSFVASPTDPYAVIFTGQAKKGHHAVDTIETDRSRPYTIPTLAPAGVVVEALARLRNKVASPVVAPCDVNRLVCRRVNSAVRVHVHPDMTFHGLRTLYALLSYESFKPHSYGVNAWVSHTLGHCGQTPSIHYTRMQVFGVSRITRHRRYVIHEDFDLVSGTHTSPIPGPSMSGLPRRPDGRDR